MQTNAHAIMYRHTNTHPCRAVFNAWHSWHSSKPNAPSTHSHHSFHSLCHTFLGCFLEYHWKLRFPARFGSIKPCHWNTTCWTFSFTMRCSFSIPFAHFITRFPSISFAKIFYRTSVTTTSSDVRWTVNQCTVSINYTPAHSIININILKSMHIMHIRTRSQNFTIYTIRIYMCMNMFLSRTTSDDFWGLHNVFWHRQM